MKCNHEFPQTPEGKNEWIAHRGVCTGEPPVKDKPVKKATKKKKLVLTYQYSGECSACNSPVKTLVVDVGGANKVMVVAYCQTCDKQTAYREVAKI